MYVVIPINGLGSRFKNEGYALPKPLVKAAGDKIVNHVVNHLNLSSEDTLIVGYSKELERYEFETTFKKDNDGLPRVLFKLLDQPTRGAAETLLIVLNSFDLKDDSPVLSVDCDTVLLDDVVTMFRAEPGNVVFYFDDTGDRPIYSYIKTDSAGNVVSIKEKTKISMKACTGAYGFVNVRECRFSLERAIMRNQVFNGEFYLSCVYDAMIETGLRVRALHAPRRACLGTPYELKENVMLRKLKASAKRFCFDLDGTLITHPRVPRDYNTVAPIKRNIQLVQDLHSAGNHIIIFTARGMRTFEGNAVAAESAHRTRIEHILKRFGVPYHELIFGKPWADVYVDDLAVNAHDDLEKAMGYYVDKIECRRFNNVEFAADTVIKTTANPGEMHWYMHAPACIKHYLPKAMVVMPDKIHMERIRGVSANMLYVNKSFTCAHLELVMEALDAFHACVLDEPCPDLGQLYQGKLNERHACMPANVKDDALKMRLACALEEYSARAGPAVVMHGDPVFTNIMFDSQGCVKLFDMRGKVGDCVTLAGDALYDWAKVYQSLIGYDHILEGKELDWESVQATPVYRLFVRSVKDRFGNQGLADVQVVAASLLYTLIPLHNEHHLAFLNLSRTIADECASQTFVQEIAHAEELQLNAKRGRGGRRSSHLDLIKAVHMQN